MAERPSYPLMNPIYGTASAVPFSISQKDVDMSTNSVYNTEVDNATSFSGRLFYAESFCSLFPCDF